MDVMAYLYFELRGKLAGRVEEVFAEHKRKVDAGNEWIKKTLGDGCDGLWMGGSRGTSKYLHGVLFPKGAEVPREWVVYHANDYGQFARPHNSFNASTEWRKESRQYTAPDALGLVLGEVKRIQSSTTKPTGKALQSCLYDARVGMVGDKLILMLPKTEKNAKVAHDDLKPMTTAEFVVLYESHKKQKAG